MQDNSLHIDRIQDPDLSILAAKIAEGAGSVNPLFVIVIFK